MKVTVDILGLSYSQALRQFRRKMLMEALVDARGNACEAARRLGMHRNTFARSLESEVPLLELREALREMNRLPPGPVWTKRHGVAA